METTLEKDVQTVMEYIVQVQNGRLKIERLCYGMQLMSHCLASFNECPSLALWRRIERFTRRVEK